MRGLFAEKYQPFESLKMAFIGFSRSYSFIKQRCLSWNSMAEHPKDFILVRIIIMISGTRNSQFQTNRFSRYVQVSKIYFLSCKISISSSVIRIKTPYAYLILHNDDQRSLHFFKQTSKRSLYFSSIHKNCLCISIYTIFITDSILILFLQWKFGSVIKFFSFSFSF